MANNKKDEGEFLEDYSNEEEAEMKPKKRNTKRKSKTKVIAWIIAFIVILGVLLLIRFKYAAPEAAVEVPEEEAPAEETEEQYVTAPETEDAADEEAPAEAQEAGPAVVPKEDLPKIESNIDTTIKPELFSNIRCEFDDDSQLLYIKLRINNILGEDVKISPRGVMKGYNTYFIIRGIVDTDPGCNTELVKPGEWTECKKIGFDAERYANIPGINRISVQVPGKTEALLVECPALPQEAAEASL